MTAVLSRTSDPLIPLLDTLARLAAASPDRAALAGLVDGLRIAPPAEGWTLATDLLATPPGAVPLGGADALTGLLDTAGQRWHAAPHAAAALAWKCYSYWVSLPAILGYAVARRVPLMTPDAVAVRWSHHQPFLTVGLTGARVAVLASDPLAVSPGPEILVVPDDGALRAALRSSLIDGHLAPLVERLRTRVHVGRRTLMGSVASGVAHGLSRAADALPGATLDIAQDLLTLLDIDELVSITPAATGAGLAVQRRTCCLAFTLPEPKICAGCCIRTH